MGCLRRYIIVAVIMFALPIVSYAYLPESILAKNISIHVNNMRVGTVLKTIEEKGNFTFSYNSNIVKTDSLVTINADNWTIKEVLDHLLLNRFEYKETSNFVILRYAPLQLSLTTEKAAAEGDEYHISGFVTDEQSGKKLENASVYDRVLLQSVLTDKEGHFELFLRNNGQPVTVTVSREFYKDTTITFLTGVTVNPNDNKPKSLIGYIISGDNDGIETTSLGRLFISTKQQIQAANLHGLIAQAPFQASAIPGVSTHAEFSGQVVNTVSLNAVGGYNAGVDGFELGLIFNLDQGDVGAVQIAGIFNVVGGNVNGFQLGGLYNNVLGNVRGIQLSLLHNSVKHDLNGIQLSGVYNHTKGNVAGMQLAILGNVAGKKTSGMQVAGLFNYARNLRGVQLGLVNIADTSSGYSIGLINIVNHGYHKLALSSNETLNANLGLKTGSRQLYTIWQGGIRFDDNSKLYAFGFGFGRELGLGKRLALNPELTQNYVYQGNWARTNLLSRLDASLTYKAARSFSINVGPSLNFFYSDQRNPVNGYAWVNDLHHSFISSSRNWTGWVGWTVGVSFF
ncbi:hypothetical protein [Mucilaginibacter aquaedulcis]|uniref:hypothetical protein n=1 Tax=Mucilaginibacter aquaedulcis TaxID=1187081 RepID=UPI0025B2FF75|nr:hypothetical protein [Mucilaginibacter aquaedulcis]MDN3550755.1 hypothetical protein [Mucilaginibacter aquaedulcis]